MKMPIRQNAEQGRQRQVHPLPGGLGLGLERARVHEICGPARVSLAAMIIGQGTGPVLWISPAWLPERLFPAGLAAFADPGRLLFATARRPEDLLWSMEEALRAGAIPLVLADLSTPPALTPVRRLHLAAGAGAAAAHHHARAAPLGLLLTPEEGGAQGVESRWHLAGRPSASTQTETGGTWHLTRLRARMAPPAAWALAQGPDGAITLHPAG